MYVRLAFAIAASVEPDILVIDEALAVGDAVFQHRCLRRIKELHDRGCTVLFVSHDTAAVRALCDRAILLNAGRMIADGSPADVLNDYQRIVMERQEAYDVETANAADGASAESTPRSTVQYTYRHGDGSATIVETELCDSAGRRVQIVETGAPLTATVSVRFEREVESPVIGFLIRNRLGIHAYGTNSKEQQLQLGTIRTGEVVSIRFAFRCWLGIDDYSISFAVHSLEGQAYDWVDGSLFFRVVSANVTEGVANLNATATVVTGGGSESRMETESVSYG
jgi:ABC-type glutathione transport system ATPase component